MRNYLKLGERRLRIQIILSTSGYATGHPLAPSSTSWTQASSRNVIDPQISSRKTCTVISNSSETTAA